MKDTLVAMGLQSCWVTDPTRDRLVSAGLVYRVPSEQHEAGEYLHLQDGVGPDEVWAAIGG